MNNLIFNNFKQNFLKMRIIFNKRRISICSLFMIFTAFFPKLLISQSGMAVFPNSHVYYENNLEQLGYFEKLKKGPMINGKKVLNVDFLNSNIKLINDTCIYKSFPARINIYENALEVNYKGEIKYLPVEKIENIEFPEDKNPYLTQNSLNAEIDAPVGFYKLLYDQESTLVCHYSYKIKEATYNVQFDVGQEYDEVVIEKDYYLIVNNKMIKLEKSRKKLLKQLGEGKEVRDFLKQYRINPKDEQDLVKLLEFYDSAFNNCLNA
jgi:hypothetical protein